MSHTTMVLQTPRQLTQYLRSGQTIGAMPWLLQQLDSVYPHSHGNLRKPEFFELMSAVADRYAEEEVFSTLFKEGSHTRAPHWVSPSFLGWYGYPVKATRDLVHHCRLYVGTGPGSADRFEHVRSILDNLLAAPLYTLSPAEPQPYQAVAVNALLWDDESFNDATCAQLFEALLDALDRLRPAVPASMCLCQDPRFMSPKALVAAIEQDTISVEEMKYLTSLKAMGCAVVDVARGFPILAQNLSADALHRFAKQLRANISKDPDASWPSSESLFSLADWKTALASLSFEQRADVLPAGYLRRYDLQGYQTRIGAPGYPIAESMVDAVVDASPELTLLEIEIVAGSA